jgi:hypothetical protein
MQPDKKEETKQSLPARLEEALQTRAELEAARTGNGQLMEPTGPMSLEDQSSFAWGTARFSLMVDPRNDGYVIHIHDKGRAPVPSVRFKTIEQLAALLDEPEYQPFLLSIVRLMSPAAPKAVREFLLTVQERMRLMSEPTVNAAEPAPQTAAATLTEQLKPELFYYVSQDKGKRVVNAKTGSLLKESAENMGRLSGKAIKNPANRHEIWVLTGAQVLQEGFEVRS